MSTKEERRQDFEDVQEIERQKMERNITKTPFVEWTPGQGLRAPEEQKRDALHG